MRHLFTLTLCLCCTFSVAFSQTTVFLSPSQDNTLFEDPTGQLSNGAGSYLFAGKTAQANNSLRRGLLAFPIQDSIPAGATITQVELALTMSKSISGAIPISLHRVTTAWGEGASAASGEEGAGAQAVADDATWTFAKYDTASWTSPGGDFIATASGSQSVNDLGTYLWSDSMMNADVQFWLDSTDVNHGWLILGSETGISAKRFDSRENTNAAARPRLEVTYEIGTSAIDRENIRPLKLYPNPADRMVQFEMPEYGEVNIQLLSASGQQLRSLTSRNQSIELDVSALPSGFYTIIAHQNGKYYRSVLSKN